MQEANEKCGTIWVRVFGTPLTYPSKTIVRRGISWQLTDKDWLERTHPAKPGKKQKYDKGHFSRWQIQVQREMAAVMFRFELEPFPKNHPVAIGILLLMPKPPTCNLEFPSRDPDLDNLEYVYPNAGKRSRMKKGDPGRYPDGVLWYEDNQIMYRLEPSGMIWATPRHPPGVLIQAVSAYRERDRIKFQVAKAFEESGLK